MADVLLDPEPIADPDPEGIEAAGLPVSTVLDLEAPAADAEARPEVAPEGAPVPKETAASEETRPRRRRTRPVAVSEEGPEPDGAPEEDGAPDGAPEAEPRRLPRIRERYVDEVRRSGDEVRVRVGSRWLLVRPLGDEAPRFEQRNGMTFLIGRYQLRATRAPRVQVSLIEGEGDLPEEAAVRPAMFLRDARRRHRSFHVRPSGVEILDGEPVLVTWIGEYRGLIPRSLAVVTEGTRPEVRRRMENLIGYPVIVEVVEINNDDKLVVLSRKDARERQARNRVERGQRVRMAVRQVQQGKVIGDIGGRDVVVLAQDWDGLFHEDLRQLPELQVEDGQALVFDVEISRVVQSGDGEYCFGTRLPIVGNTWEDKIKKYRERCVYGGVTESRTANGESWFVRLEEGLQVVATSDWSIFRFVKPGAKVNVYVTSIRPDQQRVYGRISGIRQR